MQDDYAFERLLKEGKINADGKSKLDLIRQGHKQMPTPPKSTRKEIKISSEAFDELTGALNENGIKLEVDDEFTVKRDIAVKGPINYRQVNLRHQILMEVAKVYKPKIVNDFEVSDSKHFIDFLDDVYKYCLKGDKPGTTAATQTTKKSGW